MATKVIVHTANATQPSNSPMLSTMGRWAARPRRYAPTPYMPSGNTTLHNVAS
ncbi:Uncharacterised protein [Mycobacterium tuberculosis]|nr:Uncharacterised protein [Mycobacterium tuberculosis]